ncbi:UNKNOWN [Stylonychia lemnae]|uniref:Uncharacterized protein n=1 Tax=Stylonychia lemnae TaxID=5949 RepID=A0A078B1N6_STYLE|nr:UNKNOWN [Stylonychia lemnae]|eukprot:CDW88404.1 UNKNOWN [Stylonychia lemnae]
MMIMKEEQMHYQAHQMFRAIFQIINHFFGVNSGWQMGSAQLTDYRTENFIIRSGQVLLLVELVAVCTGMIGNRNMGSIIERTFRRLGHLLI